MKKVLGFIRDSAWDKMDAVQYYRTYLPLREVNRAANDIQANVIGTEQIAGKTDDELGGFDVYTMCRVYHEDCEGFIAEIHKRGGLLVLDSDDDLTEDHKLVGGRGEEFKKVLGLVDYVTCSRPELAAHLSQYTQKPPTVLKNQIDVGWMQAAIAKAKRLVPGLTIGFSGSPTHWGDWYPVQIPFAHIVRDFDVVPVLHGEVPRYLTFAGQYSKTRDMLQLSGVPYSIYPVVLSQFDVVLCAVDSTDKFNVGKSAVKALEAMAVGAVPICSRFQPYLELEEAGAPVVIVQEDSPDGWYEAMRMVITTDAFRRNMSDNGPPWVREHRDMVAGGFKAWENFYREITD